MCALRPVPVMGSLLGSWRRCWPSAVTRGVVRAWIDVGDAFAASRLAGVAD
jgi:hypothetical protein